MYLDATLEPVHPAGNPARIVWDSETGALEADPIVRQVIEWAIEAGTVSGPPHPTVYRIDDPLRDPVQMAAILSMRWRLPEELGDVIPFPEEEEEGVIH